MQLKKGIRPEERTLKQLEIINLPLFKHTATSNSIVDFTPFHSDLQFPGLVPLFHYFAVGIEGVKSIKLWSQYCVHAVWLSFFRLFSSGILQLEYRQETKSYFGGMIKKKFATYHITTKGQYTEDDIICQLIYDGFTNVKNQNYIKLKKSTITDDLLKVLHPQMESSRPHRLFMINYWKKVEEKCPWFTLKRKRVLFGQRVEEIIIEENELKKLKNEISRYRNAYYRAIKESEAYRKFGTDLEKFFMITLNYKIETMGMDDTQ